MFRKMMSMVALGILIGAPLLMSQGRGGRGGGGGQGGGGIGVGQKTTSQSRQRMSTRAQQRQQIRATDQQQKQLRDCSGTADRIRTQAREMARTKAGSFNVETARRQRDQLREQVRTMNQEHQQLMEGLSGEQKAALQSHIQKMDRLRERVRTHLDLVDGLLAENEPNRKQVVSQAQNIEKSMEHWRKQYREMASEMGATD